MAPLRDALLANRSLLPADVSLVLAVSGGADSMALLHAAALAAPVARWRIHVGHLDHALRPESADDAEFVADVARSLDLPVTVRRADVAALARDEGRSIEDAGREARYRFLDELGAAQSGSIVTAHTADDAAETVLLHLLRGAGPAGVRGIPERRGRIVRPLIGQRRATLRAALDAAGLAYRDDPSNADPAYLRNRVRHELLPLMESLRPGAVEAIARFSAIAAADDALLDALAAAELARRRDGGEIDWRDPPSRALGRRVLRLAIGVPSPSFERLDALLDAAEGERGGLHFELGAGITASVLHRRIRIGR